MLRRQRPWSVRKPVPCRSSTRESSYGANQLTGIQATLWWTYKKLLKMAIEIVDFPIKHGDFPLLWKDPPCFMGKSTISMAIFNSFLLVHQRVRAICHSSGGSELQSLLRYRSGLLHCRDFSRAKLTQLAHHPFTPSARDWMDFSLGEHWNPIKPHKTAYFMVKTMVFPVQIFPNKPIHLEILCSTVGPESPGDPGGFMQIGSEELDIYGCWFIIGYPRNDTSYHLSL